MLLYDKDKQFDTLQMIRVAAKPPPERKAMSACLHHFVPDAVRCTDKQLTSGAENLITTICLRSGPGESRCRPR
jgi:hypothetical protein